MLKEEKEEPSKQSGNEVLISRGGLATKEKEAPQQHFDISQFLGLAPDNIMSFTMMVLENNEEDELKHCPKYLREIFKKHPYLLEEHDYNEPRKHEVIFSLNIDLKKRIYNRPRPLTHDRQEIKEEVLTMERKEIFQRALSIHNSSIVAVRKKNGKIRICNDFRKLNELVLDPIITQPPLKYLCRNFYGSRICLLNFALWNCIVITVINKP